jgi:hypothetical protein
VYDALWSNHRQFIIPYSQRMFNRSGLSLVDVVEEFLSNYPDQIRKITEELRRTARRAMPRAHEFLYYDAVNYSLSDSPLERICYISPAQSQVTLGFLFGANLDDKHQLLQGIGKRARHIKIRTLEEAKNPVLKELVKAAWTDGAASISNMRQETRQLAAAHNRTKKAPRSRRKTR